MFQLSTFNKLIKFAAIFHDLHPIMCQKYWKLYYRLFTLYTILNPIGSSKMKRKLIWC